MKRNEKWYRMDVFIKANECSHKQSSNVTKAENKQKERICVHVPLAVIYLGGKKSSRIPSSIHTCCNKQGKNEFL